MTSLDQFLYDLSRVEKDDLRSYLEGFFAPGKLDLYLVDERCSKEDVDAISKMFEQGDVLDKASAILDKNPFCLEAFYTFYKLEEDAPLYYYFETIASKNEMYDSLSAYHKFAYESIMTCFVNFLSDIGNVTGAINNLKVMMSKSEFLYNNNLFRLCYLYAMNEDLNNYYKLYLDTGFKDAVSYILLIVVCLKHGDRLKAKEVYHEFLSVYKYGEYIDHIWDLDDNNEDGALEVKLALKVCYDDILAIPYFFMWCADNKEKIVES